MARKRKFTHGDVVVITGASSGLGRAGAIAFAKLGARLVLAARRADDLEETASLCRTQRGEAIVCVTDVTVEDDVQRLAEAALSRWGRIDVWVNNAGVTLFAPLEQSTFAEHRRVIETNLFGSILGARAVIPVFRRQKQGVLINVGSVLSQVGQPFVPSYAISKFAIRGLSESLRSELSDDPNIHVCTLLPYTIDTPHFQSGANEVGKHARALPPIQSPEKVARGLVELAQRPRRELHIPRIAALGVVVHELFPETTERLLFHVLRKWHFDDREESQTSGNLFGPVEVGEGTTHGQRRPRLGTVRLLAWSLMDLVRMPFVDAPSSKPAPRSSRASGTHQAAPQP